MMNPVQAMGVFHEANGSIPASVAVSDTIMIARPAMMDLFTVQHGPAEAVTGPAKRSRVRLKPVTGPAKAGLYS